MEEGSAMYITSRAFKNGSRIPPQYTQDGQGAKSNISPPLEWYNVPEEAKCLALIVEDPEPQMENSPTSFAHWYHPNPSVLALCGGDFDALIKLLK